MNNTFGSRPKFGFIVEGEGEFYCYPSLVCRFVFPNKVDGCWENVDEEETNPAKWLKSRLKQWSDLKSPRIVREITAKIDPLRIAEKSRSFKKFVKELKSIHTSLRN